MSSKDQQSLTLSHATLAHALNASDWFSFSSIMHIILEVAINKYYLYPHIHQLALKLGTFPFTLSPPRRYLFIVSDTSLSEMKYWPSVFKEEFFRSQIRNNLLWKVPKKILSLVLGPSIVKNFWYIVLFFQEYILNQRGLIEIVGLHKDNISRGGQTSKELTITYLKELTPKLYQQLLKIYQIDFDLFGYEAPDLNNA